MNNMSLQTSNRIGTKYKSTFICERFLHDAWSHLIISDTWKQKKSKQFTSTRDTSPSPIRFFFFYSSQLFLTDWNQKWVMR